MQTLSALRNDPYFAKMFAYVHVLCWPILVWQINRFFPALKRAGITNALYTVNRWGFLKLLHTGDRHDPHAYRPRPRTFRPLTDESYASALPTNLIGLSPFDAPITLTDGPILRSLRRSRKGALPSIQNTS